MLGNCSYLSSFQHNHHRMSGQMVKWFTTVTTVLLSPSKNGDVDVAMETLKQLNDENPSSLVDDLIIKQKKNYKVSINK